VTLSVVVPAFNEEAYLPRTFEHIGRARHCLRRERGEQAELLVVDNGSTDSTAELAGELGATVVPEPLHNIARVRNSGARAAAADRLVFLDADVIVPERLLVRIAEELDRQVTLGGAVDTYYRPGKRTAKLWLGGWRMLGRALRIAQGGCQFCRRSAFDELRGYNERLYMGEDVDFYVRLKRLARRRGGRVVLINDVRILPSTRRYDRRPAWTYLVWDNPLVIPWIQRRERPWGDWYRTPIR
jgi:glycosyltransferase involved in cell wall biosynthesis